MNGLILLVLLDPRTHRRHEKRGWRPRERAGSIEVLMGAAGGSSVSKDLQPMAIGVAEVN